MVGWFTNFNHDAYAAIIIFTQLIIIFVMILQVIMVPINAWYMLSAEHQQQQQQNFINQLPIYCLFPNNQLIYYKNQSF